MNKLLLLISLLSVNALAQDTTFSKIFHKMPNNVDLTTNTSCRTNDGNYFIAGQVSYGYDAFIQRLDSVGNEMWMRRYKNVNPQFENFRFFKLSETSDGNLLLAGRVHNDNQGLNNPLFMKLDTSGDTIWTKSFSAVGNNGCSRSFAVEGDQNEYYLIWNEYNVDELFVSKYDANGIQLWNNRYPLVNSFQIGGAAFDTISNQLYVTGLDYFTSNNGGLFCIDETGSYQWGTIHPEILFWNCEFKNNSLYVSCRLPGNYSSGLANFDTFGGLNWLKEYNTNMWGFLVDEPIKLEAKGDSLFVLHEKGDPSMWSNICQVDAIGEPISACQAVMILTGAHFTSEGGFMLIGNGPMYGIKSNSTPHYGLVKTDSLMSSSDCIWSNVETANTINGPVVSSWGSTSTGSTVAVHNEIFYDTIIAYTEPGCVRFLGNVPSLPEISFNIFPNPSSGALTIQSSESGSFEIQLIDNNGRMLMEKHFFGDEFQLDLSSFENGLYLYFIKQNDETVGSGRIVKSE